MPHDAIAIQTNDDWAKLRDRGLKTVVDPMVYRTADLFLQGRSACASAEHAEQVWNAISKNVGALAMFFDCMMSNVELPVFELWTTFRNSKVIETCDFLIPVTVGGSAVYRATKDAALEKVRSVGAPPDELAASIVGELSAYGYEWEPELEDLATDDERERLLRTFLLGGFLFQGYAQQITGDEFRLEDMAEHVLQPKRSRLIGSAMLGAPRTEEELFAQLLQAARQALGDGTACELTELPTFLPILLRYEPKTPKELLDRAFSLRANTAVEDYRALRRRIRQELGKGRPLAEERREMKQIARRLAKDLSERSSEVSLDWSVGVKAALPVPVPWPTAEAKFSGKISVDRIAWWLSSALPGKGYRKLLVRMVSAQATAGRIDAHLRRLWLAG